MREVLATQRPQKTGPLASYRADESARVALGTGWADSGLARGVTSRQLRVCTTRQMH